MSDIERQDALERDLPADERSPQEIEREIERTRERMSSNIDALGDKLSPDNLKQQAKEAIAGEGAGRRRQRRRSGTPDRLPGAGLHHREPAARTVTFPMTGGEVTLYDRESGYRPWVQGTLFHEGSGLSLTAGGTTVELTDFTIDPGKPARLFGNVSVNGQLAAPSAPLFNLDGSTLNPPTMDADGSAVLQGTTVKLSPEAAALLNQTFSTDALAGGFVIGVATVTVETK